MENNEEQPKNNFINQTEKLLKQQAEHEKSFLRKLVLILGIGMIISTIFSFYTMAYKNYFIMQPDGQVNKLIQKELELTYDMLYKFADTVIINTFNYSYRDIDTLFDRNTLFYSDTGFEKIKGAFVESNQISFAKQYQLTKSTIPNNNVYKVIPTSFGVNIYRSYSTEEITKNERTVIPNVVYEINIMKEMKANGYLYDLKVNSIKEYTYKDYLEKFDKK